LPDFGWTLSLESQHSLDDDAQPSLSYIALHKWTNGLEKHEVDQIQQIPVSIVRLKRTRWLVQLGPEASVSYSAVPRASTASRSLASQDFGMVSLLERQHSLVDVAPPDERLLRL